MLMRRILLCFLLFLCKGFVVLGQTNVGGTISANTVWDFSGSPYIVTSDIIIPSGMSLIVKPGVVVKFYDDKGIDVFGEFRAEGKEDSNILFTSNTIIPNPQRWRSIYFRSTSVNYDPSMGSGSIINYSIIENGGENTTVLGDLDHSVSIEQSSPLITNSVFRKNRGAIGVDQIDQNLFINNNKFIENSNSSETYDLIFLNGFGSDTVYFHCNLVYDNYCATSLITLIPNVVVRKNLFISNELSGFDFVYCGDNAVLNENQFIDNIFGAPSSNMFKSFGSQINLNLVTRNKLIHNVFSVGDTATTINNNNIFNNNYLSFTTNYLINNLVPAQLPNYPQTDAVNNFFGFVSSAEIDSMIFDFIDNSVYTQVDYTPFLSMPDTNAPVSPVQNVVKSDLGGGNIQLSWSSNFEADVAGYKIYWGNSNGYSFSNVVDAGLVTSYIISGVNYTDTFAVTAYDNMAIDSLDQCNCHESWFTYDDQYYLSSDEFTDNFNVSIYPNPFKDNIYIQFDQYLMNGILQIFDINGKIIFEDKISANSVSYDFMHLNHGIYLIRVSNEDFETFSQKIIKID